MLDRFRFSKFRFMIWPIRSFEESKFLPKATLLFFLLLNQNLIRSIKDSSAVTMIGTQVISFIKLWVEMPAGVIFVLIYTKLCNIMTTEQVFRLVLLFFLSFFTIFAFEIYPNADFYHPNPELVQHYIQKLPHLKWFFIMWGKWSFVKYYMMGEMWPIIIFSVFFWQLANKITVPEEASRFYIFFSLFGQVNLLFSGKIIVYISQTNHFLARFFTNLPKTELILKSMTLIIIASGIIIYLLHWYIEETSVKSLKGIIFKNKRTDILKLSVRDSFKMILNSKYLAIICILLISYSTTVNLIEGLWMSRVKTLYPDTGDFMTYMGNVLYWTGISTLCFALIGNSIIKLFGWFWAAIITPAMICLAGTLFFIFVLLENYMEFVLTSISILSPLLIVTFVGGLQNVLGKGAKYSLFDATKEMVYIPLDQEMKTKGKAAVDVIGTKFGKSIGASTQFICFTIFPSATHEDIAPFLLTLFLTICFIWILGVRLLNKQYHELLSKKVTQGHNY
mgnify:CR=1 FL=1